MNEKKKVYKGVLCFFCMCIILIFNIRNIQNLDMPCIEMDEFGYWTNAALFAGKNWSSVTSNLCSYYGYGYGVILALIICLVGKITTAYQCAIFLNALMVSGSMLLILIICKEISIKIEYSTIIGSFIALFYPSVLLNSQFAWSETILLFLFLVNVLLFVKVTNTGKVIYIVLLGGASVYTYMIHQRTLGLLVAVIVGMFVNYIYKKISKKGLLLFIVVLVIMFFVHSILKNYVYENNWQVVQGVTNSSEEHFEVTNDYSSQINNIRACFSVEGIKCFVIGFLGKVYYMGCTSFFIVMEGILFLINRLKNGIKNGIVEIFLLLAIVFMLGISTVFLIYPGRIDTVLYGRYTDWLVPIFISFGFINIFQNGIKKKNIFMYMLFLGIYIVVFHGVIDKYNLTSYFPTCAPACNYYRIWAKGTLGNYWIELMHLCHCGMALIYYGVITLFKKEKNAISLLSLLILVPWIKEADSSIENTFFIGYREEMKQIVSDITALNENEIYYVVDNNSKFNLYVGSIQFLLSDVKVECVYREYIKNIDEGLLVYPNDIGVVLGDKKTMQYEHFSIACLGENYENCGVR